MQYGIYDVMTPEQCDKIVTLLETQEWKEGRARTKELTGTIKQNRELKPGEDGPIVEQCSKEVMQYLLRNKDVCLDTLVRSMMPMKFNKYDQDKEPAGGAYHKHTDAPWMGPVRTDFTVVVCLSDPDEYEGGDHYVDHPHQGILHFRPEKGQAMIYETRYAHWVTNVTKGTRIGGLTWFESQVPDNNKRAILKKCREISFDAESRMDASNQTDPWRELFVNAGVIHSALFRMWGQRNPQG